MITKRKICVVTGSRADYGHLYWLLRAIQNDKKLRLQLVVTGMHLKKEFGLTYRRIEDDGFKADAKLDILRFSNSEEGVSQSIGLGVQLFAKTFKKLNPDMVIVFGDRFEMLSATIAAYVGKYCIVHLHGGERTEGLIDEGIRHSITKMAHIHLAGAEDYRTRIIQMGEHPSRVFNVGTIGLDHVYRTPLFNKNQLEAFLKFKLGPACALVTFHPETLDAQSPVAQIKELLKALKTTHLNLIFTKTNADPNGRIINKVIGQFCRQNSQRCKLFDSLGQKGYYSCLKHAHLMIGNSSSGLIEAPSFGLPVVNIGERQRKRLRAENVIDVDNNQRAIKRGIDKALSSAFKAKANLARNPYDCFRDGRSSGRVVRVLKQIKINDALIKKSFYDIVYNQG